MLFQFQKKPRLNIPNPATMAGLMQFKFMRRAAAEKERKHSFEKQKKSIDSLRYSSTSQKSNTTNETNLDSSTLSPLADSSNGAIQGKIFIIEKTDIACDDIDAIGRFSFSGFNNTVLELIPPIDYSISDPFDHHWEGTNYSRKDEVDRIIDQFTASVDSMKQIRKRYREAEDLAGVDPHYHPKTTPPRSKRRKKKRY